MYCTLVLYRKPSGVTSVTNIWDHVEVDTFVAVSLQCYDKVPVIGKVLEKDESTVNIHYWKESWVPLFTQQMVLHHGQMFYQKNVYI